LDGNDQEACMQLGFPPTTDPQNGYSARQGKFSRRLAVAPQRSSNACAVTWKTQLASRTNALAAIHEPNGTPLRAVRLIAEVSQRSPDLELNEVMQQVVR